MTFKNEKKLGVRQLKALETKETLFRSAIELFLEKGFYNVRVDDIVQKAGTSKGTFYIHFQSKDQVIVEYYKNIDHHYVKVFEQLPNNMTYYDKLLTLFKEGFEFTENIGKELLGVVLINQISGKEHILHVTDPNRNIFKIVKHIIGEGQKNGEFIKNLDPEEITNLILQLYSGVFIAWKMLDIENLPEYGLRYIKMLMQEKILIN